MKENVVTVKYDLSDLCMHKETTLRIYDRGERCQRSVFTFESNVERLCLRANRSDDARAKETITTVTALNEDQLVKSIARVCKHR